MNKLNGLSIILCSADERNRACGSRVEIRIIVGNDDRKLTISLAQLLSPRLFPCVEFYGGAADRRPKKTGGKIGP